MDTDTHTLRTLRTCCWLVPIVLGLLVQPAGAAELFGVVAAGETGSDDAGKLLKIDFGTGIATEVGDTGLSALSALTFDPAPLGERAVTNWVRLRLRL